MASFADTLGDFVVLATETGERPGFRPRFLATWTRESTMRALWTVTGPLSWGNDTVVPANPQADARTIPVILVPGYGRGRSIFLFLAPYLRQRGYRWVVPVSLPVGQLGIAELEQALRAAVEQVKATTGAPQVDLVGFDTGGIAAAFFAKHEPAAVRRVVTLGAPWRGTRMAVFRPGKLAQDLKAGSALLDGLLPPAVPTICVYSPDDPLVIPTESAWAPKGATLVGIDGVGHAAMLLSARVFRAVHAALTESLTEAA